MVTQKDELAQPLDFQRYEYLRNLLGLLPSPRTQQGIQELLRILTPVRDAEGSRLLAEYVHFRATSAAGTGNIDGAVVAEGTFHYVVAASGRHNDPTDRNLFLNLIDVSSGQATTIDSSIGAVNTLEHVKLERSILVPFGSGIGASVNTIGGAQTVTVDTMHLVLTVGDYIVTPGI